MSTILSTKEEAVKIVEAIIEVVKREFPTEASIILQNTLRINITVE